MHTPLNPLQYKGILFISLLFLFLAILPPPMKLQEGNAFTHVCHSVGVPCDHYPWCIGLHPHPSPLCRGTPALTFAQSHASDIWWRRLEIYLNFLAWGTSPNVIATQARMFGNRVIRILLECFRDLHVTVFWFPNFENSFFLDIWY